MTEYFWSPAPGDASFANPANWSIRAADGSLVPANAVPTANDTATIASPITGGDPRSPFTVDTFDIESGTLVGSFAANSATINRGSLDGDLVASALEVKGTGAGQALSQFGSGSVTAVDGTFQVDEQARAEFTDATLDVATLLVGDDSDGSLPAELSFAGSSGSFTVEQSVRIGQSANDTGIPDRLDLEYGAQAAVADALYVGDGDGSNGELEVGTGATIEVQGAAYLGFAGQSKGTIDLTSAKSMSTSCW